MTAYHAPFPLPARRTGQAGFSHPALRRDSDGRYTAVPYGTAFTGIVVPSVGSEVLLEVVDNMVTLPLSPTSRTLPKSGPFPLPALPGVHGTTDLSVTPHGPACPSRASGWRAQPPPLGFPVLRRFSCANMPSPLPRWTRGWVVAPLKATVAA